MKKLREIARVHLARCEAGDMQAIKELANRLDGRPAQILEHSGPDSEPIARIVREIVHVNVSPEQISAAEDESVLIDWRPRRYVRPGSCARAAGGRAPAAPLSATLGGVRWGGRELNAVGSIGSGRALEGAIVYHMGNIGTKRWDWCCPPV